MNCSKYLHAEIFVYKYAWPMVIDHFRHVCVENRMQHIIPVINSFDENNRLSVLEIRNDDVNLPES